MSDTPPPPPSPTPSQPPPPSSSTTSKGFFGRLFDLSFSEFITPSLIKVIYVLGIVLAGLAALFVLVAFANAGDGGIVIGIIVAPLVFMLYVLLARVFAEIYLILFKIEENTRKP